jgi:CheY-like chemotaxis protein
MVVSLRVLIADDNHGILSRVSQLLRSRFEVVAEVADGRAAVEAAVRLDPDLVVLDIAMPTLNGIRVARELRRYGLRAKIVFLTMHSGDDYLSAAFESGAIGFVSKSRLQIDLIPALEHAYAGYRFVSPRGFVGQQPAPPVSLWFQRVGGFHTMQFYRAEHERLSGGGTYVMAALNAGAPVIYIDSEVHLRGLERHLESVGLDLRAAIEQGHFITLDVDRDVLPRIMAGGRPDPAEMTGMFEGAAKRISLLAPDNYFAVAGEIAPVLWARGLPEAALEVECLSDEFARAKSASLFCTYPTECLYDMHQHQGMANLCGLHDSLVPELS